MPRRWSIIIPTGYRVEYLRRELDDLIHQDFRADRFEILVVDDTAEGVNRPLVEALKCTSAVPLRWVPRRGPQGPNAARNTGIEAATGDMLAFVDDDCRFDTRWLRSFDAGVDAEPGAECYGGPIRVRLEGKHPRWCGRDVFPITNLDHGPTDRFVDVVFSANMAVPRGAFERVGRFKEDQPIYGDETEWIMRLRRCGGLVRYLAGAGTLHTRFGDDLSRRGMLRAARLRGRNIAISDREQGLTEERATVAVKVARLSAHALLFRCWSAAAHACQAATYLRYA